MILCSFVWVERKQILEWTWEPGVGVITGWKYLETLFGNLFSSVQSLSRVRLFAPMDCSTPGLPVHHQLQEFTRTHVHWVGDAIQPSHPLSSHSPPVFNHSQHQGFFKWVSFSHPVAKSFGSIYMSVLIFQFVQPSSSPTVVGSCCPTQGAHLDALWWLRRVGWWEKWEGGSEGRGYMYTYSWLIQRKQTHCKAMIANKQTNKLANN